MYDKCDIFLIKIFSSKTCTNVTNQFTSLVSRHWLVLIWFLSTTDPQIPDWFLSARTISSKQCQTPRQFLVNIPSPASNIPILRWFYLLYLYNADNGDGSGTETVLGKYEKQAFGWSKECVGTQKTDKVPFEICCFWAFVNVCHQLDPSITSCFLAVQNSSIGDLVTHSLTH